MSAELEVRPLDIMTKLEEEGLVTPTALILTEELTWEAYESLATYFGKLGDSTNWWLGDLLIYGERIFGEEAAQAVEASGRSPQTLQQACRVAMRISPGRRRRELSWSHHRTVAPLEPEEQDAWLERAVDQRWTRRELEAQLKPEPVLPEHATCPTCGGKGWVES